MTVMVTEGVRQAEERTGQDSAPAPFDTERLDTPSKGAVEREQEDASVKRLLFQPWKTELAVTVT